jgi:fructan beta-fructosidase
MAALLGDPPLARSAPWVDRSPLYREQYRPQFHFTPPQQWMNDPNGMVYYDGEYHLFYQYNPYDNVWGPMHWGHAVTQDLVHWENLPVALYPDRLGAIFSGSAVLDADDTSGFGAAGSGAAGTGAAGNPPLVAIFTYHDHLKENLSPAGFQSQGIAYSLDKGRNWVKYADNPVLPNPGVHDFRDPKVSWFAASRRWIMTLAVGDHVSFYSSPDLKTWTHESDFGKEWGAHGGVWECPDLLDLPVAGTAPGAHAAVLLVSVGAGAANGGSGTQYFVGRFDGHAFTPDAGRPAVRWVDYGTDDYAGSTWYGAKPGDDRTLFIGWMSDWVYARKVPTEHWRSAMTLPRELRLVQGPDGAELRALPVRELAELRRNSHPIAAHTKVSHALDLTPAGGGTGLEAGLWELELSLDLGHAGHTEVSFSNAAGEHTVFRLNQAEHRYELDRSASGAVNFSPTFAALQTAPMRGISTKVSLRAFIDRSSVEIFIDDGATVFTSIVFPSTPYDRIGMTADGAAVIDAGTVYALKSIWPQ